MKNKKEITDQKEVNNELFDFNNNLFENDKRRPKQSPKHDIAQFSSSIQIPRLIEEQPATYEISISENELICALKNMPINKSHDKDHLITEFYKVFWDELKITFIKR